MEVCTNFLHAFFPSCFLLVLKCCGSLFRSLGRRELDLGFHGSLIGLAFRSKHQRAPLGWQRDGCAVWCGVAWREVVDRSTRLDHHCLDVPCKTNERIPIYSPEKDRRSNSFCGYLVVEIRTVTYSQNLTEGDLKSDQNGRFSTTGIYWFWVHHSTRKRRTYRSYVTSCEAVKAHLFERRC